MKLFSVLIMGVFVMLTLNNCMATGPESRGEDLSLSLLYKSNQCSMSDGAIESIVSPTRLDQVLDMFNLSSSSLPLDLGRQSALLISRGYQPNTGYQLDLINTRARMQGDTLQIEVEWLTPSPDMMYAQVMTHPCLLIAIPKGGYKNIQVVDQFGGAIGTVTP